MIVIPESFIKDPGIILLLKLFFYKIKIYNN